MSRGFSGGKLEEGMQIVVPHGPGAASPPPVPPRPPDLGHPEGKPPEHQPWRSFFEWLSR